MTPLRIAWNSANSKNHLIQYKLFGNVPKIEFFLHTNSVYAADFKRYSLTNKTVIKKPANAKTKLTKTRSNIRQKE